MTNESNMIAPNTAIISITWSVKYIVLKFPQSTKWMGFGMSSILTTVMFVYLRLLLYRLLKNSSTVMWIRYATNDTFERGMKAFQDKKVSMNPKEDNNVVKLQIKLKKGCYLHIRAHRQRSPKTEKFPKQTWHSHQTKHELAKVAVFLQRKRLLCQDHKLLHNPSQCWQSSHQPLATGKEGFEQKTSMGRDWENRNTHYLQFNLFSFCQM